MKEKLYTIPVNDAFDADSECPICVMRKSLEAQAIEFTMGPSYMEDDIRGETSRLGFCEKHLELLYKNQNRLGLALIMKTHLDKIVKEVEKHTGLGQKVSIPSLFKKKGEGSGVVSYLEKLEETCYICHKIEGTFDRYIATIFHLYRNDESFRSKMKASKGFCTKDYGILYASAPKFLSGEELNTFIKEINELFVEHMKRVSDDLEWFINKFDYRYADEPWKNAKDALPRAIQKADSIVNIGN